MKYTITDTQDHAVALIHRIEQLLGDRIKPGTFYSTPIEITNEQHEKTGCYIVKIIDKGELDCTDALTGVDLVDFDSEWFQDDVSSDNEESENNESD